MKRSITRRDVVKGSAAAVTAPRREGGRVSAQAPRKYSRASPSDTSCNKLHDTKEGDPAERADLA
jgi:hypothetical protein